MLFAIGDAWINNGDSVVIGPDGAITAGPMRQEIGILYAEIDLSAVGVARRSLDVAGHYSRPDLFQLKVKTEPLAPIKIDSFRSSTFADGCLSETNQPMLVEMTTPSALRPIDHREVRIFSGSSNTPLAGEIAHWLELPLTPTGITRFSNDNLYVQLGGSCRGRVVFVIQSLSPPVNDHLMELLMMLDAARGAAAREVHAVIPYFSFARSDKKDAPRISITARLVADLLVTAGATHVMTMMLHSPQVHGFFSLPTDPLTARGVLTKHFQSEDLEGAIVVAPDMGSAKSAARFSDSLSLPVAAGNKERVADNKVIISSLVGHQVEGFRRAIIFDDEIATGSSVIELARLLSRRGIQHVDVVSTHGVFVKGALDRLHAEPAIQNIVVTDTVSRAVAASHPRLKVLSVAPVFGEAILHNWHRHSIGDLFDYGQEPEA